MKHFKDANNKLYGLDSNNTQDYLISELGLIPITNEEFLALLQPPAPTEYELEEIKRALLAEAIPKRDFLLMHLYGFCADAVEERSEARDTLNAAVGETAIAAAQLVYDAANAKVQAIKATISSLRTIFTDQRVIDAIDGAVADAVKTVYLEIFTALYLASPSTYFAMLALDPL